MVEPDTIRLLRECDAGIKMGVSAIEEVVDRVADKRFRRCLTDCAAEHDKLKTEIQTLLDKHGDEGKDPNPIVQGISHMKTGMKLGLDDSDQTIAGLMTDGCNMGVKSLSQYLNQYKAADETSKNITKRLIALEERLAVDIRGFL